MKDRERHREIEGELIRRKEEKKTEEGLKRIQRETRGENARERFRAGGKVEEGSVRCKERVTDMK